MALFNRKRTPLFISVLILLVKACATQGFQDPSLCDLTYERPCRSNASMCVPLENVQDGYIDCPDGSDEGCPEGWFVCQDRSACIAEDRIQDGFPDCYDESDEACDEDFQHECLCGHPQCIDKALVGDGVIDCLEGSDELAIDKEHYICPDNLQDNQDLRRKRQIKDVKTIVNGGVTTAIFPSAGEVDRPTGVLTSTIGTFINEGTTSEYLTVVQATSIDGSYALVTTKSSRVFFALPTKLHSSHSEGFVSSEIRTRFGFTDTSTLTTNYYRTYIDGTYAQLIETITNINNKVSKVTDTVHFQTISNDKLLRDETSHDIIENLILNDLKPTPVQDQVVTLKGTQNVVVKEDTFRPTTYTVYTGNYIKDLNTFKFFFANSISTDVNGEIFTSPVTQVLVKKGGETSRILLNVNEDVEVALPSEPQNFTPNLLMAHGTANKHPVGGILIESSKNILINSIENANNGPTSMLTVTIGKQTTHSVGFNREEIFSINSEVPNDSENEIDKSVYPKVQIINGDILIGIQPAAPAIPIIPTFTLAKPLQVTESTSERIGKSLLSGNNNINKHNERDNILAKYSLENGSGDSDLPTITYVGFADFTTTISNTVVVLTPKAEIAKSVASTLLINANTSPTFQTLTSLVPRVISLSEEGGKGKALSGVKENINLVPDPNKESFSSVTTKVFNSVDQYPSGLVSSIGGTIVNEGVTTLFTTYVYGTFIQGQYAQVVQSTSSIFYLVSHSARLSETSKASAVLKTITPTFASSIRRESIKPTSVQTSLDLDLSEINNKKQKQGILDSLSVTTFTLYTTYLRDGKTTVSTNYKTSTLVSPLFELSKKLHTLKTVKNNFDTLSTRTYYTTKIVDGKTKEVLSTTVLQKPDSSVAIIEAIPIKDFNAETTEEVVTESSTEGSTDIPDLRIESSLSPEDEINAVFFPKTYYTTYTYFTTYHRPGTSSVVSSLETITNIVKNPKDLQAHQAITPVVPTYPVTYWTTFTYWTTYFKDSSSFTTSTEKTISNIVNLTVNTTPTSSSGLIFPTRSADSLDFQSERPAVTTYYTTFTYYTSTYIGDSTIVNSHLETVTNIVTNPKSISIPVTADKKTQKELRLYSTGLLSTIRRSTVLDDTTTVFSTNVYGTIIDGLYAEIMSTTSNIIRPSSSTGSLLSINAGSILGYGETTLYKTEYYISTINGKKSTITKISSSTKGVKTATVEEHATGLLREIAGSIVEKTKTTFYTSAVVGTFQGGLYSEVVKGTSSVRKNFTKIPKSSKVSLFELLQKESNVASIATAPLLEPSIDTSNITPTPVSKVTFALPKSSIKSVFKATTEKSIFEPQVSFAFGNRPSTRRPDIFAYLRKTSASEQQSSVEKTSFTSKNTVQLKPSLVIEDIKITPTISKLILSTRDSEKSLSPAQRIRFQFSRNRPNANRHNMEDVSTTEKVVLTKPNSNNQMPPTVREETDTSTPVYRAFSFRQLTPTGTRLSLPFEIPEKRKSEPSAGISRFITTKAVTEKPSEIVHSVPSRVIFSNPLQRPNSVVIKPEGTSNSTKIGIRPKLSRLFPRRNLRGESSNFEPVYVDLEGYEIPDIDYIDILEFTPEDAVSSLSRKKRQSSFGRRTSSRGNVREDIANMELERDRNEKVQRNLPFTISNPITQRESTREMAASRSRNTLPFGPRTFGRNNVNNQKLRRPSTDNNIRPSSRFRLPSQQNARNPSISARNQGNRLSAALENVRGHAPTVSKLPTILSSIDGTLEILNDLTVFREVPVTTTIPVVENGETQSKVIITASSREEIVRSDHITQTEIDGQIKLLLSTVLHDNTVTQVFVVPFETTSVEYTPTVIGGRRTSASHIVPSTVFKLTSVVSTKNENDIQQLIKLLLETKQPNPLLAALGFGGPQSTYRVHTLSYITTVTNLVSTELPVIFRGKTIKTTVVNSAVEVVTATELSTETIIVQGTVNPFVNTNPLHQLLPLLLQGQLERSVDIRTTRAPIDSELYVNSKIFNPEINIVSPNDLQGIRRKSENYPVIYSSNSNYDLPELNEINLDFVHLSQIANFPNKVSYFTSNFEKQKAQNSQSFLLNGTAETAPLRRNVRSAQRGKAIRDIGKLSQETFKANFPKIFPDKLEQQLSKNSQSQRNNPHLSDQFKVSGMGHKSQLINGHMKTVDIPTTFYTTYTYYTTLVDDQGIQYIQSTEETVSQVSTLGNIKFDDFTKTVSIPKPILLTSIPVQAKFTLEDAIIPGQPRPVPDPVFVEPQPPFGPVVRIPGPPLPITPEFSGVLPPHTIIIENDFSSGILPVSDKLTNVNSVIGTKTFKNNLVANANLRKNKRNDSKVKGDFVINESNIGSGRAKNITDIHDLDIMEIEKSLSKNFNGEPTETNLKAETEESNKLKGHLEGNISLNNTKSLQNKILVDKQKHSLRNIDRVTVTRRLPGSRIKVSNSNFNVIRNVDRGVTVTKKLTNLPLSAISQEFKSTIQTVSTFYTVYSYLYSVLQNSALYSTSVREVTVSNAVQPTVVKLPLSIQYLLKSGLYTIENGETTASLGDRTRNGETTKIYLASATLASFIYDTDFAKTREPQVNVQALSDISEVSEVTYNENFDVLQSSLAEIASFSATPTPVLATNAIKPTRVRGKNIINVEKSTESSIQDISVGAEKLHQPLIRSRGSLRFTDALPTRFTVTRSRVGGFSLISQEISASNRRENSDIKLHTSRTLLVKTTTQTPTLKLRGIITDTHNFPFPEKSIDEADVTTHSSLDGSEYDTLPTKPPRTSLRRDDIPIIRQPSGTKEIKVTPSFSTTATGLKSRTKINLTPTTVLPENSEYYDYYYDHYYDIADSLPVDDEPFQLFSKSTISTSLKSVPKFIHPTKLDITVSSFDIISALKRERTNTEIIAPTRIGVKKDKSKRPLILPSRTFVNSVVYNTFTTTTLLPILGGEQSITLTLLTSTLTTLGKDQLHLLTESPELFNPALTTSFDPSPPSVSLFRQSSATASRESPRFIGFTRAHELSGSIDNVSGTGRAVVGDGRPDPHRLDAMFSIGGRHRPNLATRIMSNGVEVIVAGNKESSRLPPEQMITNNFEKFKRPITLPPSTLLDEVRFFDPDLDEAEVTRFNSPNELFQTNTYYTTFTYFDTLLVSNQPLVISSLETLSNVVTVPLHYTGNYIERTEIGLVTQTYYSTNTVTKTTTVENLDKLVTSTEVITQVVITEAPTVVRSSSALLPSFVTKTYFTTYTYYNTEVDGDYTNVYTDTLISSDIVTEKSAFVRSTTLVPARTYPGIAEDDLLVYATKTYYTTTTFLTTVLKGSETVTMSNIDISSTVVTEIINSALNSDHLYSLKSSYLAGEHASKENVPFSYIHIRDNLYKQLRTLFATYTYYTVQPDGIINSRKITKTNIQSSIISTTAIPVSLLLSLNEEMVSKNNMKPSILSSLNNIKFNVDATAAPEFTEMVNIQNLNSHIQLDPSYLSSLKSSFVASHHTSSPIKGSDLLATVLIEEGDSSRTFVVSDSTTSATLIVRPTENTNEGHGQTLVILDSSYLSSLKSSYLSSQAAILASSELPIIDTTAKLTENLSSNIVQDESIRSIATSVLDSATVLQGIDGSLTTLSAGDTVVVISPTSGSSTTIASVEITARPAFDPIIAGIIPSGEAVPVAAADVVPAGALAAGEAAGGSEGLFSGTFGSGLGGFNVDYLRPIFNAVTSILRSNFQNQVVSDEDARRRIVAPRLPNNIVISAENEPVLIPVGGVGASLSRSRSTVEPGHGFIPLRHPHQHLHNPVIPIRNRQTLPGHSLDTGLTNVFPVQDSVQSEQRFNFANLEAFGPVFKPPINTERGFTAMTSDIAPAHVSVISGVETIFFGDIKPHDLLHPGSSVDENRSGNRPVPVPVRVSQSTFSEFGFAEPALSIPQPSVINSIEHKTVVRINGDNRIIGTHILGQTSDVNIVLEPSIIFAPTPGEIILQSTVGVGILSGNHPSDRHNIPLVPLDGHRTTVVRGSSTVMSGITTIFGPVFLPSSSVTGTKHRGIVTAAENLENTSLITYISNTQETVTSTKTELLSFAGKISTYTQTLLKTLQPHTVITTIVGAKTEINTFIPSSQRVKSQPIDLNYDTVQKVPLDYAEYVDTLRADETSNLNSDKAGDDVDVYLSEANPGIAEENEISRAVESNSPDQEIVVRRPVSLSISSCKLNCRETEVCKIVDNEYACVCRAGFSRKDSSSQCLESRVYTVKLVLDNVEHEALYFDSIFYNFTHPTTKDLSDATIIGISNVMSNSNLKDFFHNAEVLKFGDVHDHPTLRSRNKMDNGVVADIRIVFSAPQRYKSLGIHVPADSFLNSDDLKFSLANSLAAGNFSLGGTGLYANRDAALISADDFDECSSVDHNDCATNAVCMNKQGTFTCACENGYTDAKEELPGRICTRKVKLCDACSSRGECIEGLHGSIQCRCLQWYGGNKCEINLKVMLIVLVSIGSLLVLLLLVCAIMCCVKGRSSKPHMGHVAPPFLKGKGIIVPSTIDRRAMIQDSSSESSTDNSRFHATSFMPPINYEKGHPFRPTSGMSATGRSSRSHSKDRSIGAHATIPHVLIPRVKCPPTKRPSLLGSSGDGDQKVITHGHDSKSELGTGSRSRSASRVETFSNHNNGRLNRAKSHSRELQEEGSRMLRHPQGSLHSGSSDRLDRNGSEFGGASSFRYGDRTVSEARSCDETTVHPPIKTLGPGSFYSSKALSSQHISDEVQTMAERDAASTVVYPQTEIFRPMEDTDSLSDVSAPSKVLPPRGFFE